MVRLQQAIDCGSHVNFLYECYTSPNVQGDFQPTRAVSIKTISEEVRLQEENSRYLFLVMKGKRKIGYGYSFRSRAFDHFEIGVTLIPAERHKGFGLLAHRLLVVQTFVEYRAKRLTAYTCLDNKAERSVLERCSFLHEGTMRQAGIVGSVTHDIAVYGSLRQETEVLT